MTQRILSRSEYTAILNALRTYTPRKSLECLKRDFPCISPKTLWSINNVIYTGKMKKNTVLLRRRNQFLSQIYNPLWRCASKNDHEALVKIADKYDIAPSLVAKRVLEEYYSSHQIPTSVALAGTGIKTAAEKATIRRSDAPKQKPIVTGDSPISLLYNYVAVHMAHIEFQYTVSGPEHKPLYTADLILTHENGEKHTFADTAHSKQLAKHGACMRALDVLTLTEDMKQRYDKIAGDYSTKITDDQLREIETLTPTTNRESYVTLLSRFTQLNQTHFEIEYTREGPPHEPEFTGELTVHLPGGEDVTATGKAGPSKKEAKQNAAYEVLLQLPLPEILRDEFEELRIADNLADSTDAIADDIMSILNMSDTDNQLVVKGSDQKKEVIKVTKIDDTEPADKENNPYENNVNNTENTTLIENTTLTEYMRETMDDSQPTSDSLDDTPTNESMNLSSSSSRIEQIEGWAETSWGLTCESSRIVDDKTAVAEDTMQFAGKKTIQTWMREPHRIPDKVLSSLVSTCTASDTEFGPIANAIQMSIGQEHEYKLELAMKKRGLFYRDEKYMRKAGYDKTPDMKLEVPIAVAGKVINWIESKAIFADENTHKKYLDDQLWSYWNRFGSGMVIYWFGHVDDLEDNSDKGIYIWDHFPEDIETMECFSKN